MKQYLDLCRHVLDNGERRADRTGVGTVGVFGTQLRFDLSEGFPLVTTKRIHLKSVVHELLWMLAGDTNVRRLRENGVTIWDEWADADGDLGPVYGKQWRAWQGPDGRVVDQMADLLANLRRDPYSRRHVVTAWNPGENDKMALSPCHAMFQFHVQGNRLSCLLFQRSVDCALGLPFNVAAYALLTHILALHADLVPGDFVWTGGDTHVYLNHVDALRGQLDREPRPLPKLVISRRPATPFDHEYGDFSFEGYDPHPAIRMAVAV